MRVTPPDSQQSQVLADVLERFGWTRFAVVGCAGHFPWSKPPLHYVF